MISRYPSITVSWLRISCRVILFNRLSLSFVCARASAYYLQLAGIEVHLFFNSLTFGNIGNHGEIIEKFSIHIPYYGYHD